MLLFHLRVLTGISTFDVTAYITDFPFHVPKIKIFNWKYFWIFKKKFYLQNTWMVFVFLNCLQCWVSFFNNICKLSSFLIFNSLTLLKNSLKASSIFHSTLEMSPFSRRVFLEFVKKLLFDNKRLNVFQNGLLSVILLMSRD